MKHIVFKDLVDFDGNKYEEEWDFHISSRDIVDLKVKGFDLLEEIENLARSGDEADPRDMLSIITRIILHSVGRKSEDGRRFVKNDSIQEDFKSSAAYEALLSDLFSDADNLADFFTQILPRDAQREAKNRKDATRDELLKELEELKRKSNK